jgi:hypothetical protein
VSKPAAKRIRIGWREWLALPDLGIAQIKAKIDTGARSSALHAFDINLVDGPTETMVHFRVAPLQRSTRSVKVCSAPLLGWRQVRNSGGQETLRPVVISTVDCFGLRWPIELTLINRDAMGFRLLLGRQALRQRFLVHPGRSYLAGQPDSTSKPIPGPRDKRKPL